MEHSSEQSVAFTTDTAHRRPVSGLTPNVATTFKPTATSSSAIKSVESADLWKKISKGELGDLMKP